jgi:hypothetical protein
MKKALLFSVAMLGLVSCQSPARFSQAYADWETEGWVLGNFKCPGIPGKIEWRKYMVHVNGLTIKGKPIEKKGLRGFVTDEGGVAVTYKGKHCKEME